MSLSLDVGIEEIYGLVLDNRVSAEVEWVSDCVPRSRGLTTFASCVSKLTSIPLEVEKVSSIYQTMLRKSLLLHNFHTFHFMQQHCVKDLSMTIKL